MTDLPTINYKDRDYMIAPTKFRGGMNGKEEDLVKTVTSRLSEIFRNFNVSLLMLDLNKTGYVGKKEIKILLKAFNLQDGRANYIMSRCDHNGKKGIAYVDYINQLIRSDYPGALLPAAIGPNPVVRHKQTVKAMTARSNYSGSLTSGSSRGSVTDRSSESNLSLASYMSSNGAKRGNALQTGNWPGHRQMTYSSQGSYRSERSAAAPQLPELFPAGATNGLRPNDLEMLSEGGRSRRSNASSIRSGRTLPFMRRSPSKGSLKFSFNEKRLSQMKYGELYKRLNDHFLRLDEEQNGYLSKGEIRNAAGMLEVESYNDVLEGCAAGAGGDGKVSYIDFLNGLKQKMEPGEPSIYTGMPKRPRMKRRDDESGSSGASPGGRRSMRLGPEGSTHRSPKNATAGPLDGVAAFADQFGKLDVEGTGKMSPGEIMSVCRKFDMGLSDDDLDRVLMRCKVREGKIQYMEFVQNLRKELMKPGFDEQHHKDGRMSSTTAAMSGPPARNAAASESQEGQLALSPPKKVDPLSEGMANSPKTVQNIHRKYAGLSKAFRHSDRSGSGFLQEKELRRLCEIYQLNLQVIEKAMAKTFVESDGNVSHVEFTNNLVRVEFAKGGK